MSDHQTGTLRAYLRANMFDGCEDGSTTMPVKALLDEVCQNVAHWMVDATDTNEHMDDYYADPAVMDRYFKALAEVQGRDSQ